MILHSITMKNFKCFRSEQTLTFGSARAEDSSFCFLSGRNDVEPALGANGVGKSTIWDALTWCLYGKTARGLRAGKVVSWGEESCEVEVELQFRGPDIFKVRRSQNPNSLELKKAFSQYCPYQQEKLEQLLGLNYWEFLNSILMGQFNPFFFDLGASDKLNLFSQIMGLDFWVDRSDEAKKTSVGISLHVGTLTQQITRLEGRKETLAAEAESCKDSHQQWLEEQQGRAKGLENQLADLNTAHDKLVAQHECDSKEEHSLSAEATELREKRDNIHRRLRGFEVDERDILYDLDRIEKMEVKFTKAYPECPTCNQPFSKEQLDENLDELGKDRIKLQTCLNDLVAETKPLKDDGEEIERQIRRVNHSVGQIRGELAVIEHKSARLDGLIEAKERELSEQQLSPFLSQIESLQIQATQVKKDLVDLTVELDEANRDFLAYGYWAKGFKDLRLWIVDTALQELEIEVNNSLVSLGLVDWRVEFEVQKEKADGGITRGFTVNIFPPGGKDFVPWEAWSGGETQRLRIAGAVGMSNLILSRRGIRTNIEVWDEPTAHLGQEGIDKLLDFFADRSRRESKQVGLVDHRSLDYGGFDRVVRTVKGPEGSLIGEGVGG